jgi:hypothetical protein
LASVGTRAMEKKTARQTARALVKVVFMAAVLVF